MRKLLCNLCFLAALILLPACGNQSGSSEPGIKGVGKFTYSVSAGRAYLSVVFESLSMDVGARVPLSKPEGGYIELSPDFQSAGTLVAVSVPLSSLFKDHRDLPVVGLPDGRAIPGVRGGALGAAAVELPVIGLSYFYLSADAYGIFFPVNLPDVPVLVSSKVKDDKGNLLGIIWGIPKNGKATQSGVLFLFPVDGGV
jgi:hypothetical protein